MTRTAPHPTLTKYVTNDAERQHFVTDLFNRSAPVYDRIVDVMSFGSGIRYRREALERAGLKAGMRVLDVATGTGLVTRAALDVVGDVRFVTGVDPSAGMLAQARTVNPRRLIRGVGESLPVRSGAFDFLCMGYALRHLPQLETAFADYRRVLKPGGRMLLLEISRPESRAGRAVARLYFKRLVPLIARVVTHNADGVRLMRYYWDTIESCVPPGTIVAALRQAGFSDVERQIVQGIFSEYRARSTSNF
jgi:demethylmenaquinone methyltransferase/2-methoxy-6-polyprenyl-1,4-benzoquinol methylase